MTTLEPLRFKRILVPVHEATVPVIIVPPHLERAEEARA